MNMHTLVRLSGLGVAALTLAACTASPYIPEDKFSQATESRLRVMTGSRIPQMVDINDASPRTMSPTSIITAENIRDTGEWSLCRAIRRIVPNMIDSC